MPRKWGNRTSAARRQRLAQSRKRKAYFDKLYRDGLGHRLRHQRMRPRRAVRIREEVGAP